MCKLAVKDGLSFKTIATSETLRELFQMAGYEMPVSPNTVKRRVLSFYNQKRDEAAQLLKSQRDIGQKFSVSLDEWTSCAKKRYINVNVHSVDLGVINLGLIRVHGSATAEACKNLLEQKLEEVDLCLKNDVVAVVTDGASVMLKFGRLIGKHHQLCLAHGIHLAVVQSLYAFTPDNRSDSDDEYDADTEEEEDFSSSFVPSDDTDSPELVFSIQETVKKVRRVVKFFNKSPLRNDALQDKIRLGHDGKELILILDTRTRWNSLVDMIERFLRLVPEVKETLDDLGKCFEFEDREIASLKEILSVLKPVKLAVDALCRRDATLITADAAIKFMMEKVRSVDSEFSREFYEKLKTRIIERRNLLSEVLHYLHTGRRNSVTTHDFFQGIQKTILCAKILALASPETESSGVISTNYSGFLFENSQSIEVEVSMEDELNNLIHAASTENALGPQHDTSLESVLRKEMALFENGGSRGKILESVYKMLKSITPTSVESERAFSCANNFCTKTRSKLHDNTLNSLVFLKSYFDKK